jgi:hypothetical protein
VRAAELPGMASVVRWTVLAIAVALALAFVSMLLGLAGSRGTLIGGPWVTLMLGFILLNSVMLGAGIWVAHLVAPVTSDAADAAGSHAIYVPYLITSGVPLVAWAAVVAVVAFGLIELGRRWRVRQLPAAMRDAYRSQAQESGADSPARGRSGTNPDSSPTRAGSGQWPGRNSWPGCRWTRAGCCGG